MVQLVIHRFTWLTKSQTHFQHIRIMNARPLNVLAVSSDRKLLRHLSHFLEAFGFAVQAACGRDQGIAALSRHNADLIIVDADLGQENCLAFCRNVRNLQSDGPRFTLLLAHPTSVDMLQDALQAGIDDFLVKPIVHGEILTRLRAGARMLEFERRIRHHQCTDPASGFLSQVAFEEWLRTDAGEVSRSALVLFDIDHLQQVCSEFGSAASKQVVQEISQQIRECRREQDVAATLGGGRLAVLLPGATTAEAEEWAEQVRKRVAAIEFDWQDTSRGVTVSGGVVPWNPATDSAEFLLEDAVEAVRSAKRSGRNCIVQHEQFAEETVAWSKLAAPGKLFAATVARDVMTSCPLVLLSSDSLERAAELFRGTAAIMIPVVDRAERLVGVLDRESVDGPSRGSVEDRMNVNVVSVDEETPFDDLMDQFVAESLTLVIVLHEGRPTGYVLSDHLATISEPLTSQSYAPAGCHSSTRGSLIVPLLPGAAENSASSLPS